MSIIRLHSLKEDDEGFWQCRHCHRISKDPALIHEMPCIEREVGPVGPDPDYNRTEFLQVTQAVADGLLQEEPDALNRVFAMLENELRWKATGKNLVPRGRIKRRQSPMSTMPGYVVLVVEAEFFEAKKVEIQKSIPSEQWYFLSQPSRAVDDYANREVREYARRENVDIVGDPVVRTWPAGGASTDMVMKVTFWTRPRLIPRITFDGQVT